MEFYRGCRVLMTIWRDAVLIAHHREEFHDENVRKFPAIALLVIVYSAGITSNNLPDKSDHRHERILAMSTIRSNDPCAYAALPRRPCRQTFRLKMLSHFYLTGRASSSMRCTSRTHAAPSTKFQLQSGILQRPGSFYRVNASADAALGYSLRGKAEGALAPFAKCRFAT
jgi:hypothetical protein